MLKISISTVQWFSFYACVGAWSFQDIQSTTLTINTMNTKFTAKDLFLKHWKHWSFKVKLGLAYSSSQLSETKQADAPKTPITFLYWDFFTAISRADATMVMTSFKFTSQTQWTRNFCVERTLEIMVFAGRGFWLGILENEVWKSSEHWKHNKHISKKGTVFSEVFIYKNTKKKHERT